MKLNDGECLCFERADIALVERAQAAFSDDALIFRRQSSLRRGC